MSTELLVEKRKSSCNVETDSCCARKGWPCNRESFSDLNRHSILFQHSLSLLSLSWDVTARHRDKRWAPLICGRFLTAELFDYSTGFGSYRNKQGNPGIVCKNRLGGEERRLMHLVPAPAVRLMKSRVLSRPGVNSLVHNSGISHAVMKFQNFWSPDRLATRNRRTFWYPSIGR